MTIGQLIQEVGENLERHRVESPQLTAELLVAHVLSKKRLDMLFSSRDSVSTAVVNRVRRLARRRAAGEPLQYVTGIAEFCGLEMIVDSRVLIPRPETELLVEAVVNELRKSSQPPRQAHHTVQRKTSPSKSGQKFFAPLRMTEVEGNLALSTQHPTLRILDLCTGSGCIAIALAKQLAHAHITAVDISAGALAVARENARRHRVLSRIKFLCGDIFDPVPPRKRFHVIVSNPPYVAAAVFDTLQREIRDHEPRKALVSGATGLEILAKIIRQAPQFLLSSGLLALEIGFDQREQVNRFLDESDYKEIVFIRDLQSHSRVAVARKPNDKASSIC